MIRAEGLALHFLTLLFNDLPGRTALVLARMRATSTHVGHVLLGGAKRSEWAAGLGPGALGPPTCLMAAPARSVPSCAQQGTDDALANGGLHVRALLLLRRKSPLASRVARHVREDRELYRGPGRALRRIDVRRVERGQEDSAAALLWEGMDRDPSLEAGFIAVARPQRPPFKILARRLHGYLTERAKREGTRMELTERWLEKELRRGVVPMLGVTWDDEGELVADEGEPKPGFLAAWKQRSARH
ncbi:MAG: hypothetical protein ICV73_10870 [Acetobacteraceae bacterium]|nr:hypothetical protein [Acetobacteraceae bacterium]